MTETNGIEENRLAKQKRIEEREIIKEADLVVRIVPAPSKTGEARHDGAENEVRKAKAQGKPVIEIYDQGGRKSPGRSDYIEDYKKKVDIHLQEGEHLKTGLKEGIKKLKKKGVLDKDFPDL